AAGGRCGSGGPLPAGGWPAVMGQNPAPACAARRVLCEALDIAPPSPESMLGSLASVPLPDGRDAPSPRRPRQDPLQNALFERYAIEVPVMGWPATPRRLIRISAQLYNSLADYERLAEALRTLLRG